MGMKKPMIECKHENQYLKGTAEGIYCQHCGAFFKTFAEIHPAPAEPAPEKPKPRTRKKKAE